MSDEVTLGLYPTDNPTKFGMIKTDQDGKVIYHQDKPAETDADLMWGIAVWEPHFTERLHNYLFRNKQEEEPVLGDVIDEVINETQSCRGFEIPGGAYYDIGTYDDYKKALHVL